MQEIMELMQKAGQLLAKPDASRGDKTSAVNLLKSAKNRLEVFVATLEAGQRR